MKINWGGTALRRFWPALAFIVLVPVAALGLYFIIGGPARSPVTAASQAGEEAGDLGESIERLRKRLEADPSDVEGWRLLARSYEYLGKPADAAEARRRADELAGRGGDLASQPEAFAALGGPSGKTVAANPLVREAHQHLRNREYREANESFAELVRRGQMDADLWADYADSLGAEHGHLDAQAERCIDSALQLDPRHPKALWLLGSVQTQRGDYRAALRTWQTLAALMPADSPDGHAIAANIEEARRRASSGDGDTPREVSPGAALSGTVQLEPRWRGRVAQGATLFVFARAADERGPPLAVLRTTVGTWPLNFTLDDGNAMLANRRLSDFSRVVVEARISQSGNPIAQPGDLRGVSGALDPRSQTPVQLVINTEVPERQ